MVHTGRILDRTEEAAGDVVALSEAPRTRGGRPHDDLAVAVRLRLGRARGHARIGRRASASGAVGDRDAVSVDGDLVHREAIGLRGCEQRGIELEREDERIRGRLRRRRDVELLLEQRVLGRHGLRALTLCDRHVASARNRHLRLQRRRGTRICPGRDGSARRGGFLDLDAEPVQGVPEQRLAEEAATDPVGERVATEVVADRDRGVPCRPGRRRGRRTLPAVPTRGSSSLRRAKRALNVGSLKNEKLAELPPSKSRPAGRGTRPGSRG